MTQNMGDQVSQLAQNMDQQLNQLTQDMGSQVTQMTRDMDGQMLGMRSKLDDTVKMMSEELTEAIASMNGGLDGVKSDIANKVHKENVQSYRNIQALLKELDHREEELKEADSRATSLRKRFALVSTFAAVDFVALLVILLKLFGIF